MSRSPLPPPDPEAGTLLALHHTPEAAAEQFDRVARGLLAESPHIRTPQFEAATADDLARLLALYDRHVFDGLLGRMVARSGAGPVHFRWSSRLTSAAGKTFQRRTRRRVGGRVVEATEYEIAISSFLLFQAFRDDLAPGGAVRPVDVVGVRCANRLEALLRIFEHELLHLAEFLAFGKSSCSAGQFRRLSRAIFGHEASVHAMMTPRQFAAEVHAIRPGDRVAFTHDGLERVGIVRRITKRATVLVPDPAGQPYSDGNRYSRYLVPLDRLRKA